MDKTYSPAQWEPLIRTQWETDRTFVAPLDTPQDTFCIILPPPNANGSLHAGHVMMVYQDIMCRAARAQGKSVLYLPGTDHAGFETQFVFEKHLAKQGKSRFDYDRETLYHEIEKFVIASKDTIIGQFKSIGFSLDWSKEQFTLNPHIVSVVYQTFKKLFDAGLVYRADRLVNYCTKDGTSFSDLETESESTTGEIYSIKYPLVAPLAGQDHIVVATTRPETLFADVAVMVHPDDPRYRDLVGAQISLPLSGRHIPIIADAYVDMAFGTGAVKVTPSHDFNDFEVGKRHKLTHPAVIGFDGKVTGTGTKFDGLRVKAARKAVLEELTSTGHLLDTKKHDMVVKTCYKCGTALEPLPMQQWFIKVRPLADQAKAAIESGKIKIYPPRFTETMTQILDQYIDWNISRQIVWGIRIPAFHHTKTGAWQVETDPAKQEVLLATGEWVQDADTFDTWFSSGQWPFATLMSIASAQYGVDPSDLYRAVTDPTSELRDTKPKLQQAKTFFDLYYPTSVMETGYDIARAWVARMMMLGIFVTGQVPFKTVYLHGMVRDGKGMKMSKSKGNVIDPLKLTTQYGTDALRAALVFEAAAGNDVNLSEDKVRGMRNFVNKIWNIGRFLTMPPSTDRPIEPVAEDPSATLAELHSDYIEAKRIYTDSLAAYDFSRAFGTLYEFVWHRFADIYIEKLKSQIWSGDTQVAREMHSIYLDCITMLEPFIPFVTSTIKQQIGVETKR